MCFMPDSVLVPWPFLQDSMDFITVRSKFIMIKIFCNNIKGKN